MLRNITIAVVVALFALGPTGIAVAEDDYPNYEFGNLLHDEKADTPATADRMTPEKIEKINPLFCTDDLVQENETVATNTCTEEDLRLQGG